MCCREQKTVGAILTAAGVGIFLALLLGSVILQVLLALGLTAGGIVFLTR